MFGFSFQEKKESNDHFRFYLNFINYPFFSKKKKEEEEDKG